jgi:two-component sensor histidine kinase
VNRFSFVTHRTNWPKCKLSVSDDVMGMPDCNEETKPDLGQVLVSAFAQQLDAQVEMSSGVTGITVSVTQDTFVSRLPNAA